MYEAIITFIVKYKESCSNLRTGYPLIVSELCLIL